MRILHALSDQELNKNLGAFPISEDLALNWNQKGFGIFWTVQDFNSTDRKKENLSKILSWAIDIDGGDKESQMSIIKSHAIPSLVVETKNGFHVYWNAINATVENFEAIVSDRLIPIFNADKKAKDLSRILRVPGYYHLKDPNDPFLVKQVFKSNAAYTEDQMFSLFPLNKKELKISNIKQELRHAFKADGNDIWEKVYNLDCEQGLIRLSGTRAVNGEPFSFRRVSNGNLNILVNNKSTSSWIDTDKKIGSTDKGGPTLWQWINWYHRNHKITYQYMREFFGELWK